MKKLEGQKLKVWDVIKSDVTRYNGTYRLLGLARLLLIDRTFRPIFTMRLCNAANCLPKSIKNIFLWIARFFHYRTQQLAGIDLPWETRISPGFRIMHGWGLVISAGTNIGRNVTVFHGVTIGKKKWVSSKIQASSYPTVMDDVWIGPHAVIIGGVTIGRGSRIAAGTIITKDVAPYSIVAGNPGRVIKFDAVPDVKFPARFDY